MSRLATHYVPFRIVAAFAGVLGAVALAFPVLAHPADEINEQDIVSVHQDGIEIAMTISAGSITYLTVWRDADTDGDRTISTQEREAFGRLLGSRYAVTIDGVPIPAQFEENSLQMAPTLNAFTIASGDFAGATVLAHFWIQRDMSSSHEVTVSVRHYSQSANGTPPQMIAEAAPPMNVIVQGGNDVNLRATVIRGGVVSPARALSPPVAPNHGSVAAMLAGLRSTGDGSAYALFGIVIAAAFGALHALTPGHGKTLVTAYLVGAQARPRDAFALGGIVTLTHTGSVLAIGVLIVIATHNWAPYRALSWIECVTGVFIITLGLALARDRYRMAHIERHASNARNSSSPASIVHEHEDGTTHAHGWFGAYNHHHPAAGGRSPLELLLVGMSGGMLPCPDALAILLFAVAAGHILLGLLIILSFSAGLAVVLIGLGIIVTSTGIVDRIASYTHGPGRWARWIPTASALIMVAAGAAALARGLVAVV